jgi:DNA-binding NtrC family response regulator
MPHNQEPIVQEKQGIEKTILIVEDDVSISSFLTLAITRETPYRLHILKQGWEAITVARDIKPALIVLDHCPPRIDSIGLYDQLHTIEELKKTQTIVMGTYFDEKEVDEIKKRKIALINKPFDLYMFLRMIAEKIHSATADDSPPASHSTESSRERLLA